MGSQSAAVALEGDVHQPLAVLAGMSRCNRTDQLDPFDLLGLRSIDLEHLAVLEVGSTHALNERAGSLEQIGRVVELKAQLVVTAAGGVRTCSDDPSIRKQ